jgi:soluble epoxide hydrolase / lipid-phosphate phosphatase
MSFTNLPRDLFSVSRGYEYSFVYSPPRNENPWLLFLHGFPSTAYDWRHQLPFFIRLGYGVVAPDLLGYGQSSKPLELEAYKARDMSVDIIEILNSKNISKVIGIAHDL